jgi:DNA-binding response OmpR family regulator
MARILVVEDDRHLRTIIKAYLQAEEHDVELAEDGETARAFLKTGEFDFLILDWMLPDRTGVEICQEYRQRGGSALVMMLTARHDAKDKATALDAGADDYLVKPFEQIEFQARVRALLRRQGSWGSVSNKITVGDLVIDTLKKTVSRGGAEIELRPREFSLLEFLSKHKGQSFTAEALFARLWNTDSVAAQETVRMHVMTLRKKLGDDNAENPIIVSSRGRGYKIADS